MHMGAWQAEIGQKRTLNKIGFIDVDTTND